MKTEEEVKTEFNIWWNNLRTADTIEEVKFYQGNINALLWIISEQPRQDAFADEEKKE